MVGALTTKLELAMTLPRWAPPAGTPPDLVERWQRYLAALVSHQNTRLERARELERALKPVLAATPPAPDCAALDVEVHERYLELQRQEQARDAAPVAGAPVFQ